MPVPETYAGKITKPNFEAVAAEVNKKIAKTDADAAYAPRLHNGVKVQLTAAQSVATDTLTTISFTTELWDAGGWHDNAVNPTRLTAPAGATRRVAISGVVDLQGATGYREGYLAKNGALNELLFNLPPTTFGRFPFATEMQLVAGDYIELVVKHGAGSSINAGTDTRLALHLIGATA